MIIIGFNFHIYIIMKYLSYNKIMKYIDLPNLNPTIINIFIEINIKQILNKYNNKYKKLIIYFF